MSWLSLICKGVSSESSFRDAMVLPCTELTPTLVTMALARPESIREPEMSMQSGQRLSSAAPLAPLALVSPMSLPPWALWYSRASAKGSFLMVFDSPVSADSSVSHSPRTRTQSAGTTSPVWSFRRSPTRRLCMDMRDSAASRTTTTCLSSRFLLSCWNWSSFW